MSNFKIIIGDDPKLVEYLIHSNLPGYLGPVTVEDPVQSRQLFIGKSFLNTATEPTCFITKNFEAIQKAEQYWPDLQSGKFCGNHNLWLILDKLDSRTKFAKQFKSHVLGVNLDKLNLVDVDSRFDVLKKAQITGLFKNCNSNVTKSLLELNKIISYATIQRITAIQAYTDLCLAENTPQVIDDNVFNLIEDIVYKRVDMVAKKLYKIDTSVFDFSLLVNLYNTFRNLYIYEECSARGTLSNSGLSAFNIKIVSKFHNLYNRAQLLGILKFLQKVDTGIKQGILSSDYALDYMITGVLSS